jgi:hypothetical protein
VTSSGIDWTVTPECQIDRPPKPPDPVPLYGPTPAGLQLPPDRKASAANGDEVAGTTGLRLLRRERLAQATRDALRAEAGFNESAQHLLVFFWIRRWVMVTSRVWFTATQKAELWEHWKSGLRTAAISRALDRRNKTGVPGIVTLHGGIAPTPRRRALAALRLAEREEISHGIAAGQSIRRIAHGLGRAPSTVSREIKR